MPNWCENDLIIYNNDKEAFTLLYMDFKENGISFEKMNPLDPKKSAYDEAIVKWGCKWDVNPDTVSEITLGKTFFKVSFDTPWGPPLMAIAALSKKFPGNKIKLYGYERGMGFQCKVVFLGGKIIEQSQKSYSGQRGG